jgi:glycerol-3-phosphate dehydrogenase (NAD(P)+)
MTHKKKIAYLGAGAWGFCLASLLASKGYEVTSWTGNASLAEKLNTGHEHPHLAGHRALKGMHFTTDLAEAIKGADIIVEAVTASGIRPVFEKLKPLLKKPLPIILTSKGIEQDSGLILPAIVVELLGKEFTDFVGCLSGPSYAQEVIKGLPTSVVASGYSEKSIATVTETFTTPSFRVYPNNDILGVCYGGALKNVIAIACGIAEGLGLGFSAKAALMTRGLHEIRKLALASGCKAETINGLSGMGDVCLTCGSLISRNCRFGYLLAQGRTPKEAEKEIDMVVEGVYTSISALQIGEKFNVAMPITEVVYRIVYEGLKPSDAVKALMLRTIKEEHL